VPRKSVKALDVLVLTKLAQVKALADPLRQRLLSAFAREPQTTKQIAQCLGEKPTKLYHHVDILADAGLLKLVETRQKRGTTERYYQAAAKQFSVDRHVFRHLPRDASFGATAVLENAFSGALSELHNQRPNAQEKAALIQSQIRATPSQAANLGKKFQRVLEKAAGECAKANAAKADRANYRVLVMIVPVSARARARASKKAQRT
jgi:DNA-binding transcriptional ArsR family regulator